ncbi:MAG: hypothetical protein ACKO21_04770 [Nodosilinea sp.]
MTEAATLWVLTETEAEVSAEKEGQHSGGDRLAALISTLHHLNPQAAEDVIQLYLEDEHLWA